MKKSKKSKKTKPKTPEGTVFVACVNNSGFSSEYRANSMFGMGLMLGTYGVKAASATFDEHPISLARNVAIENFIQNKQFTHLFFVDSDTFPSHPSAILQLMQHDEPVVCGWYLSRRNPRLPVVLKIEGKYDKDEKIEKYVTNPDLFPKWRAYSLSELMTTKKDKKGLITVDGVGAGCMLIKREALSHLEKPYFYEDHSKPHSFGEDLWFGLNCKKHNIPVKVDLNMFCGHLTWGIIGRQHLQHFMKQEMMMQKQQKLFKSKKAPMSQVRVVKTETVKDNE